MFEKKEIYLYITVYLKMNKTRYLCFSISINSVLK
jgi:hypothetical protein